MTTITRGYRFSASHRLHSPELTTTENALAFGKCSNPFGHGHDYRLEVTAVGTVNAATGLILPLPKLDRLIREQILPVFAHRNMNLDVPQFADLIPTTENLALVISNLLQQHWAAYVGDTQAVLSKVRIQETERNAVEV